MTPLPDLEAWALFAKVAETGSFAGAAAELGLSQPTVSKAVKRLEARLKTALFYRNSRRISLTESGQAALEQTTQLLQAAQALEEQVSSQSRSLRGSIRVAAPMSFGVAHLAPLLPGFMAQHPEVMLDLHLSDEQVDVIAGGFDVALRIAQLADSSLLARRLCHVRILLVATPGYVQRYGKPKHPRDLAQHQALQYGHARGTAPWRFVHARHGSFAQSMPTALRANNAEALTPALKAGLGLALQPEFLVWHDVQSGTLQHLMPEWQVDPIALHLLTPTGRGRPVRVQALVDYLAASLSEAPWAQISRMGSD
ncbi:MAG: LysR family transcriptional regulator [Brachymonas sp.]|nr:LysR family transcriptional regulator [Brachymonas sp.]